MSFSLFRRVWRRLVNPTGYIGRDLEGNRYYEYPNPHGESRTKRVVKYRQEYDMWTYVGGQKRLPVQWSSWLTHTRPHPPTIEELLADIERRRRVLQNVAMIQARDRAAREAAQLTVPAAEPLQPHPTVSEASDSSRARLASAPPKVTAQALPDSQQQQQDQPSKPDPWQEAQSKAGPDEPQAWAPRAVRRGA